MTFLKAAKTVHAPTGKMKHNGKEIITANVEGNFYAAATGAVT